MKKNPHKKDLGNGGDAHRNFSPLACGVGLRLSVAAGFTLILWLVVLWAMRP